MLLLVLPFLSLLQYLVGGRGRSRWKIKDHPAVFGLELQKALRAPVNQIRCGLPSEISRSTDFISVIYRASNVYNLVSR